VLNTGGSAPGLLAPVVGFLIDQTGWATAFASGAIFTLLGAFLWLFVRLPARSLKNVTPQARAPRTL